jgi:hypothetical protein
VHNLEHKVKDLKVKSLKEGLCIGACLGRKRGKS